LLAAIEFLQNTMELYTMGENERFLYAIINNEYLRDIVNDTQPKCNSCGNTIHLYERILLDKYIGDELKCLNCHKIKIENDYPKRSIALFSPIKKKCIICEQEFYNSDKYFNKSKFLKNAVYCSLCKKCHSKILSIMHTTRKNKIQSVPCDLSLKDWNDCVIYFENKCAYCGKKRKINARPCDTCKQIWRIYKEKYNTSLRKVQ
jgi:hypothetical protein